MLGATSIDLYLEAQIEIKGKTYIDEMSVGCCRLKEENKEML